MTKLSEQKIIEIFQKNFGNKKFVSEDVEVFSLGKVICVAKIDTLVESTDLPPQMKIEDAARKSIVACVSDFAAKGVKPVYGIVSITLPAAFGPKKTNRIARGLGKAAKEFGIKILGGDTNEGKELVIQVCVLGFAEKIVSRKGAKKGDLIFTTGPFGYTKAGLKILLKKKSGGQKFVKKAKKLLFLPMPKLEFGIRNSRFFSSSMDSSDGLSTTLNEMAKQSKNCFVVTSLPSNQDLFEFASHNKLDPLDLIFNGGEEYEIVFTSSPKNKNILEKFAKNHKLSVFEIGYVTAGKGVIYQKNRKKIIIKDKGWKHFEN